MRIAIYIWIFLLVCVLAGGIFVYFKIKRTVEKFSRNTYGLKSLAEGIKNQEAEYASTPKSISGMTRLYLPQIQEDFPDFNFENFKIKAENMIKASLTAIDRGDISVLDNPSEDLKTSIQLTISDLARQGIKEHYQNIIIHQTEITRYYKSEGRCVIQLQSSVEYQHYKENTNTGVTVPPSGQNRRKQTRYNSEYVYIQDVSKLTTLGNAVGTKCPNCGAPITNLGNKFCEYCHTAIQVIDIRVWSLNKINIEN